MISHATADDTASGQAATPVYLRTLSEVRRFSDGSELAGPGDADIRAWRAGSRQETQATGYGGTGRER